MKHLAIVSPHFAPSNLVGAHRARLLSPHFEDFGWEPSIITVHEKYYEEPLEKSLCDLLPEDLRVRRAWAFPVKPFRLMGDIGIRGLAGMYSAIRKLHCEKKIDFLYITLPSNFASILGPWCKSALGIPYGIDYQDPWVHFWPGTEKKFSKPWVSLKLSEVLEPWVVRSASLITGVADSYYRDVFVRNPELKEKIPAVPVSFGWDDSDYRYLEKHPREPFIFSPCDGKFHLVYAGAMLPKAFPLLHALLGAILRLTKGKPELMKNFELHFIGTGKSPSDPEGYNIRPLIEKYCLEEWVQEYPQRIPYLDTLNHLSHASGVLILGSIEKHYTPSKVFQAVLSQNPVFAILREESAALRVLTETGNSVIAFGEKIPSEEALQNSLSEFIQKPRSRANQAGFECLADFSARRAAEVLCAAIDKSIAQRL